MVFKTHAIIFNFDAASPNPFKPSDLFYNFRDSVKNGQAQWFSSQSLLTGFYRCHKTEKKIVFKGFSFFMRVVYFKFFFFFLREEKVEERNILLAVKND